MLKIGITSGIGSGKSTVCDYFERIFKVPVYYMDKRAKELVAEQPSLKSELIDHFGERTFADDGTYNTKYISDIIFNDVEQRKWMEAKIGEYMSSDYQAWLGINSEATYVMVESAIFFETDCAYMVDYVLGVECPYIVRLERVQKRNNFTVEQVIERMNAQMNEEEKMGLCDFHVFNGDIDMKDLNFQCIGFHDLFSKMGRKLKNVEGHYRNLIAKGVAYGLGRGQASISTVDKLWENHNTEPDPEYIRSVVESFFDEYGVK